VCIAKHSHRANHTFYLEGNVLPKKQIMGKPLNNSLGTKEAKAKPESKEFGKYFLPLKIK
jgi:hypothetical protein